MSAALLSVAVSVSAAITPTGLRLIIIPASMITASLFFIICKVPPLYGGGFFHSLPKCARRMSHSRFKQSIVVFHVLKKPRRGQQNC